MPDPNLGDTSAARNIARIALLRCGFENLSESAREYIIEDAFEMSPTDDRWFNGLEKIASIKIYKGNEIVDTLRWSIPVQNMEYFKRFIKNSVSMTIVTRDATLFTWRILLNLPINPSQNDETKIQIFSQFETKPNEKQINIVGYTVEKGSEEDLKEANLLYCLHGG